MIIYQFAIEAMAHRNSLPMNSMVIFPLFWYVYQRVNLHFPMVFLWFSIKTSIFLWFSYGFPLKPPFSYGKPNDHPNDHTERSPAAASSPEVPWSLPGTSPTPGLFVGLCGWSFWPGLKHKCDTNGYEWFMMAKENDGY